MGLTQVSTDGVKNDAITKTKIPANQIEASELADNAVDTNAIADQAVALSKLPHGDGSSDGKFLRANNGADPSFETVSIPAGTTINNNADNRVITGSGTANTLNGESNVIIDNSSRLKIGSINNSEALTNAPVYIEVQTDLSAINTNVGTTTTGLLRMTDDGSSTDRYHGIELRNRQGGDIRILCQDRNTSDKGDLVIGMPNVASGMAERIRFSSIYDSINIAGKGGTSLAAQGAAIQNVDVYLNTKTNITNVGEYAGQAATGLIRFEDVGADNNRFHGIELRNRNSGDVRFLNADVGVGNKGDAVIACDSGSGVNEIARFQNGGGISFNGDTAAANALDDYEEGTWTPNFDDAYITSPGTSYNSRAGKYVKVGRMVLARFHVNFAGCSGTNAGPFIGNKGLPFTPDTSDISGRGLQASLYISGPNTPAATVNVNLGYAKLDNGSYYLGLSTPQDDLGSNNDRNIRAVDISNGDVISGTVMYYTSF